MQGCFYFYEGYLMEKVIFFVCVMKVFGVEVLIVINVVGGVNIEFCVGDLMIIIDYINFMGINLLIGLNEVDFGVRFLDMFLVYDKDFFSLVEKIVKDFNILI